MRVVKWLVLAGLVPILLFWGLTVSTLFGRPVSSERVSDDAATRYPIVLAHGVMGFGYIGQQSYWRDIPETLRAHGADVYVTQVSAFNSSEVRGEQLLAEVEQIRRIARADKVNLIGHSHGSFSVRYVAGLKPEWVASVTTVAGPTTGSEVADWMVAKQAEWPLLIRLLNGSGDALGELLSWLSDKNLPQDAAATMHALSSTGAAAFNQRFPAGVPTTPCGEGEAVREGIHYYSWGTVGTFYRVLNPADYLMSLTSLAFEREAAQNDGLVGRCASRFGKVIRDDYPMNHFHSVNQLNGLVGKDVDPVGLYVTHAQRLKQAGL